jgi:hypothetical protein
MSEAGDASGVVVDEDPPPPHADMPVANRQAITQANRLVNQKDNSGLVWQLDRHVSMVGVKMFMAKLFSRSVRYFIVGRMNTKPHLLQYPAPPQGLAATSKFGVALAACLLFLLSPLAAQAEWQKVTTTDSGIIYVDDGTIKRNGPIRSFWSLLDYRTPQKAQRGAFFVSTRTHMEMDCRKEMVHILQFSMHSGPMLTGEIIDSQGVMREWQTIPPDTPLVALYKFICGK